MLLRHSLISHQFPYLWHEGAGMGLKVVELVAGIIDQMDWAVTGTGWPPAPTNAVLKTLRVFLREGVQWPDCGPYRIAPPDQRCAVG